MQWDRRVPEFQKVVVALPFPVKEHLATSRWQSCDCRTCQEKRLMLDSLPGKRWDWERYKQTSDWRYDAIFYVNE
jgi:hypothetical protein